MCSCSSTSGQMSSVSRGASLSVGSGDFLLLDLERDSTRREGFSDGGF